MRRNLLVGIILLWTSAGPAVGQPTWTKTSPGGGGAFLTADVAADGTVLVGSDLSGLYRRSGAGNWTRVGRKDGLDATSVEVIRWKPGQSVIALAGTRNGLFRIPSGDPLVPWTKVTTFGTEDVTALGWKGDTVFAATGGNGSSAITLRWSTDGNGTNWAAITTQNLPTINLRAVKLTVDPSSARTVWLLSGNDRLFTGGRKELWKSDNYGATWSQVILPSSPVRYAIDFALHPTLPNVVLVTTSETGPTGGFDDKGSVYKSVSGGETGSWSLITLPGTTDATGAVWFDGADAYLINVQANACGSPPVRSGKFKGTSTDSWVTSSWTKVDDGVGGPAGFSNEVWDVAWTDCPNARGRAFSTVARTLSAKGEYWVSSQFVWRYTATAPFKYENAFSTQIASGSPGSWITKGIDNAVPTAFSRDGSGGPGGDYFAGYYDLGIWRTQDYGASWVNKNPAVLGDWGGYGGSVTGIATGNGCRFSKGRDPFLRFFSEPFPPSGLSFSKPFPPSLPA